ncbi:MAG: sigma-70 family RNA polymerase sigma factor [Ignavibacteriales bacterium]|nr:sigma-70 family RNA polymerase sigma factor [Ignavibacteriales bacterium]
MSDKSDSALVKECLSGNKKCFEELVNRYQKPVFNVALRIINNYDDATEIAQTTFIKAFENLHTFDTKRKFFSWLYRIATNESLNYLKARKQHELLSDDHVSHERTPDQRFDEAETDEQLQNALMQLNQDYRIVLVLCHFHNLSYKEISSILDIPEKTVKSRLFSARKNLKELLEREDM